MSDSDKKKSGDLKPLYLKRRMQLLQDASSSGSNSSPQTTDIDIAEQEEGHRIKQLHQSGGASHQATHVMRNKRYISLRVKLLKRQFGLPSDVLSLKSLNLSQMSLPGATGEAGTVGGDSGFNRVHHIFDKLHGAQLTRLVVHKDANSTPTNNNNQSHMVSSSLDGTVAVNSLGATDGLVTGVADEENRVFSNHDGGGGVLDFDTVMDLLVTAGTDGAVVLWHAKSGKELRRLTMDHKVTGVRFLPNNNNLVVCSAASAGLLRVLNVSTGKWSQGASGHTTGKANCMEVGPPNQPSGLLWVGTDRGFIESFRVEGHSGKVLKGCRVPVEQPPSTSQQPRTPLAVTSLATDGKVLVATVTGSHNLFMFKIVGEFGTVTPFRAFNAGPESGTLRSTALSSRLTAAAPASGQQQLLAACGSDDGSVLFFDLDRNTKPCIDRLAGHSKPVTHATFSEDSNTLVSADLSGQVIVWKKS